MVTEACNFSCRYCSQRRSSRVLPIATARKAVESFVPAAAESLTVIFGGGEPLLEFPLIRAVVPHARSLADRAGKTVRFSITTNGWLLTKPMMEFFREYDFSVILSFDGTAQDYQRRRNSESVLIELIRRLRREPHIHLETNSVFLPETVDHLVPTMEKLLELGIEEINFTPALNRIWKKRAVHAYREQLDLAADALLETGSLSSRISLIPFRPDSGRGYFVCSAGSDQLAVTADGSIWGCPLFPDLANAAPPDILPYHKPLGRVDGFSDWSRLEERFAMPYRNLTGEFARTERLPCFLCPDAGECRICPVTAARKGIFGIIPEHVCRLQQAGIHARRRFRKLLEGSLRPDPRPLEG